MGTNWRKVSPPGTAMSFRSPPLKQMLIPPAPTTAKSGRKSLSKSPAQKADPPTQPLCSRGTSFPPRCFSRSNGGRSVRLAITSMTWSRFQSSMTTACTLRSVAGIPEALVILVNDIVCRPMPAMCPDCRKTCTSLLFPVTAIRSSFPVKSRSINMPLIAPRVLKPLDDETSIASPFVPILKRRLPLPPRTTISSNRSFRRSPTRILE